MFIFQSLARKHARVPVFMSSLCQLPLIELSLEPPRKVLIMTSDGKHFDNIRAVMPALLDSARAVVCGCEDVPYFDAVAKCAKVEELKAAPLLLKLAKRHLAADKAIGAILFECTQLPAFADYFRAELQLPVYDIVTCLDFFHSARAYNPLIRLH